MKHYLQIYVNYLQNDWVQWLADVKFVINNTDFFSILVSFFLVNYNQHFHIKFKLKKSLLQNLIIQNHINLIVANKFIKHMKNLNEYFQEQILIIQVIYEFTVNACHHLCSWYVVENQVWLNAHNFNTAWFSVKLDDHNMKLFSVIKIYKFNSLVMKLDFLKIMQIHFVFHVNLLQLTVNDSLFSQHAEFWESVVITDNQCVWYVNSIFDFKYDHYCWFHFLKYLVNWKSHWFMWKLFDCFIKNTQKILNKYHAAYSNWSESHILSCIIFFCHCKNFFSYL